MHALVPFLLWTAAIISAVTQKFTRAPVEILSDRL